ncbi:MAG TPA: wax ester/triacylglycerol synthase family O-acyltransferase [Aldersonia sp.]
MAVTHRIGALDYNWLRMDSESTPMHIGALFTFEVPHGAGDDFVGRLAAQMRAQTDFAAPWNLRLRRGVRGVRGALVPTWEENNDLDLDYHFRHSALPRPGGERELGVLVSRLHSNPLDRGRPLWEVHLIEGVAPNRFALYLKIHHSLMDGTSGMRTMLAMMSTKAAAGKVVAPWTIGPEATPATSGSSWLRLPNPVPAVRTVAEVAWGVGRLVVDDALVAPHAAPESVLSEPMGGQRRFATARVPLALAKEVAAATGGTVNDVVLWLSGTALRRFLLDSGKLPDKPLVAALPVNLRTDGDDGIGTNVAMILASIGTSNADPRARLDEIVASTTAAKAHLNGLSDTGKKAYTMVSSNALVFGQLSKLDHVLPPMFSLAISNVPGPSRPMYLAGAKLDAIHPISLLMRKGALNITCVSYDGMIDFGFIGARDTLPHLQRIAEYVSDAAEQMKQFLSATPRLVRASDRSGAN